MLHIDIINMGFWIKIKGSFLTNCQFSMRISTTSAFDFQSDFQKQCKIDFQQISECEVDCCLARWLSPIIFWIRLD